MHTATVAGVAFVLAFCSIVYELLLGQTLAAFLGNTVLRLSVTVGLYLLSMGIGAFLARGRVLARPVLALQSVELALSVTGAAAVPLLFLLDSWGAPHAALSATGHGLIVLIGVLTGLELPLLLELGGGAVDVRRNFVLGVDYVGALIGTLVFAFWFYPRAGLVTTAFVVASLNAFAGVLLASQIGRSPAEDRSRHGLVLVAQLLVLCATVVCLARADAIAEACIRLYLGGDA